MKNLIYLGIILMLASCGSSTGKVGQREFSTIKTGNLEVMTEDLGAMNWYEAKEACAALGDGWRLPRTDELMILYDNREVIGGFSDHEYWSSSEVSVDRAWRQYFYGYGIPEKGSKYNPHHVRAVRTL